MSTRALTLSCLAAALAGGLMLLFTLQQAAAPPAQTRWNPGDLVAVPDAPAEALSSDEGEDDGARRELRSGAAGADAGEIAATGPTVEVTGRVLDRFGRPLGGAEVVLELRRGAGPQRGGGERRRRVQQPLTTGGDGRFAFRGPSPHAQLAVTVRARHPAHAPLWVDRELAQGQRRIDLGELRLTGGARVRGTLVDDQGHGITGGTAQLVPARNHRARRDPDRKQLTPDRSTDVGGGFGWQHLAAGNYRVAAHAPAHVQVDGPVFTLHDGDDLVLEPLQLPAGAALRGLVVDRDGRGIGGAQVLYTPQAPGTRALRGRSDARGRFALLHVPLGPGALRVTAEDYITYHQQEIDPQRVERLTIQLFDGMALRGRVVDARSGQPIERYHAAPRRIAALPELRRRTVRRELDNLEQRMRELASGAGGAQAEQRQRQIDQLRARMTALQQRAENQPASPDRTEQRATRRRGEHAPAVHRDGGFSFRGLDQGVWVVDVDAPDHLLGGSAPVELRYLDGPPAALVIRLEPGASLTVHVATEDGRPLAGAQVDLVRPDQGSGGNPAVEALFSLPPRGMPVGSAMTGEDGRAKLPPVDAGSYAVVARHDDHAVAWSEPLALPRSDAVALRLPPLASLEGTVQGIAAAAGQPVRVVVYGGRGRLRTVVAAADGSYRLAGLEPGGYFVRAAAGAMRNALAPTLTPALGSKPQVDVVLRGGATARFDPALVVPAQGSVRGSVLRNGEPARGATVELAPARPPQRAIYHRTTTDSRGGFAFDEVPAGRYRLRVRGGGRSPPLYEAEVEVHRDTDTEHLVSLQVAQLALTLIDAAGAPAAAEGRVHLLRTDAPNARAIVLSVTAGKATASALPAGSYIARLRLQGRRQQDHELVLAPGPNAVRLPAPPPP